MRVVKFFMFNWLTKSFLNRDAWILRLNKRATSIAREMWYAMSVMIPVVIPINWIMMLAIDSFSSGSKTVWWNVSVPFSLMTLSILTKDLFSGQSVVHRKLGYKVVDAKSLEAANRAQCVIRNLTGLLWPVELAFVFLNPKRRLGDFIAGTILIEVPATDPELILVEMKSFTLDKHTLLAFLVSLLTILGFNFLTIWR